MIAFLFWNVFVPVFFVFTIVLFVSEMWSNDITDWKRTRR